jgi:hypothetical protein
VWRSFGSKIWLDSRFLDSAYKHKQAQYRINFSLCHRFPCPGRQPDFSSHPGRQPDFSSHPHRNCFAYLSVSLTFVPVGSLLENNYKCPQFLQLILQYLEVQHCCEVFSLPPISLHILPNKYMGRTGIFITPIIYHTVKKSMIVQFIFGIRFRLS